jgi:HlyD family secretion protein
MDVARSPEILRQKKRRRTIYAVAGGAAILLVTLGLARLKPAARSVERTSVWIDAVKRGPMLRQVRGLGTLVPEEIRWIPAQTQGRVERLVTLPGSEVKADTIVLELSNPEVEMQALDAEASLRAAQAAYVELKVRLNSGRLDQEAAAARVQADYSQARMQADAEAQLAEQGLIASLTLKRSQVTADELANR